MRRLLESALAVVGAHLAILAPIGTGSAKATPVTVECRLKVKYQVHTEQPLVDALNRYTCEAKVVAVSDVDATDAATRQVAFHFADDCRRLPSTVVFGGSDVTEVRERRGDRIRSHMFAGECKGCVLALNTDVAMPRVDSGHFDGRFVVRAPDTIDVMLPTGRGHLTLRSERNDDVIIQAAWAARKCVVTPRPPIFCGGIAGTPCPDPLVCVDWPGDDCDPDAGGADCVGVCEP